MKNLKSLLLILAAITIFACSGNIDSNTQKLHITANKTEVCADGTDHITFIVTYGNEDVSGSSSMSLICEKDSKQTILSAGKNTFAPTEEGEYILSAQYKDGSETIYSEEKITISASAAINELSSGWYQKLLAMEFTSVHCTYCPILAEAVEMVQNKYPGRVVAAAFHDNSMGTDPMSLALNNKIYNKITTGEGLPLFAFNFRKSSQHIVNETAKIISELELNMKEYKPTCGVAIETSYDSSTRKLSVNAKIKSDIATSYRYHIILIEDGIKHYQAGHEGAESYVHNNVVREIAADNIYGAKINQGEVLVPGKEYTASRSFNIPAEWNTENMRVVVCMMSSSDGSVYTCNNTNECNLDDNADYLYEEK